MQDTTCYDERIRRLQAEIELLSLSGVVPDDMVFRKPPVPVEKRRGNGRSKSGPPRRNDRGAGNRTRTVAFEKTSLREHGGDGKSRQPRRPKTGKVNTAVSVDRSDGRLQPGERRGPGSTAERISTDKSRSSKDDGSSSRKGPTDDRSRSSGHHHKATEKAPARHSTQRAGNREHQERKRAQWKPVLVQEPSSDSDSSHDEKLADLVASIQSLAGGERANSDDDDITKANPLSGQAGKFLQTTASDLQVQSLSSLHKRKALPNVHQRTVSSETNLLNPEITPKKLEQTPQSSTRWAIDIKVTPERGATEDERDPRHSGAGSESSNSDSDSRDMADGSGSDPDRSGSSRSTCSGSRGSCDGDSQHTPSFSDDSDRYRSTSETEDRRVNRRRHGSNSEESDRSDHTDESETDTTDNDRDEWNDKRHSNRYSSGFSSSSGYSGCENGDDVIAGSRSRKSTSAHTGDRRSGPNRSVSWGDGSRSPTARRANNPYDTSWVDISKDPRFQTWAKGKDQQRRDRLKVSEAEKRRRLRCRQEYTEECKALQERSDAAVSAWMEKKHRERGQTTSASDDARLAREKRTAAQLKYQKWLRDKEREDRRALERKKQQQQEAALREEERKATDERLTYEQWLIRHRKEAKEKRIVLQRDMKEHSAIVDDLLKDYTVRRAEERMRKKRWDAGLDEYVRTTTTKKSKPPRKKATPAAPLPPPAFQDRHQRHASKTVAFGRTTPLPDFLQDAEMAGIGDPLVPAVPDGAQSAPSGRFNPVTRVLEYLTTAEDAAAGSSTATASLGQRTQYRTSSRPSAEVAELLPFGIRPDPVGG